MVVVSVSQPGYGKSDGPPDYCGPFTQEAVLAVIEEVRKWPFVNPDLVGVYGTSRGAIVASMVETKDRRLAAAVLDVGSFDMVKEYKKLTASARIDSEMAGILSNVRAETGATEQEFEDRSAIYHATHIKTPTLILNGAKDLRVDEADIKLFGQAIEKNGVYAKVVIFPDAGHFIPFQDRNRETFSFLEKFLGIRKVE